MENYKILENYTETCEREAEEFKETIDENDIINYQNGLNTEILRLFSTHVKPETKIEDLVSIDLWDDEGEGTDGSYLEDFFSDYVGLERDEEYEKDKDFDMIEGCEVDFYGHVGLYKSKITNQYVVGVQNASPYDVVVMLK